MKISQAAASAVLFFAFVSCASAAQVACNVEDYDGSATVFFGKVTGDYNLDNFENGGMMSINVAIEGNDNKYEHQASVRVTKTDTYIEPTMGAHISKLPATMDQFGVQFGAFPSVTCTLVE